MAIVRMDRVVQTAQGQAVSGALVYFLTQPANVGSLTPLASVFSSTAATAAANPQISDGLGQVSAYLDNSQLYTIVVVSPLIGTQVYPDQALNGSGAGTYTTFSQVPAGIIDGVNTSFSLAVTPQLMLLALNGLTLTPGLSYTLTGSSIQFATAPAIGDTLFAQGTVSSGLTPFSAVPAGVIDGTNRVFTLAAVPILLFFTWDGVVLTPGVGYTLAGRTITMAAAPAAGDTLFAQGIG